MKLITFEKSVGAVVFINEGSELKYLLLKYRNGHWSFPKGHVISKETDEETLRREMKEETGITELMIIPGFKGKERYFYSAKGNERKERMERKAGIFIFKKVVYYATRASQESVRLSHEHLDFRWMPYEEALRRITYKNGKRILKDAHNFLTR